MVMRFPEFNVMSFMSSLVKFLFTKPPAVSLLTLTAINKRLVNLGFYTQCGHGNFICTPLPSGWPISESHGGIGRQLLFLGTHSAECVRTKYWCCSLICIDTHKIQ